MACWQRRGKINHLQIQSVLYFSLYEKTGSSLTLCHPSTNAPNIIQLLNISCGDQSVLLTAFTQDVLFFTPLGKIKKKLIPFSLAALFCRFEEQSISEQELKNQQNSLRAGILCKCSGTSNLNPACS
jgi:hypothetical protein